MSEHTPGPWVVGRPIRGYEASIQQALNPLVVIADVPNPDNTILGDARARANALVIAASPRMLETLEAVADAFGLDDLGGFTDEQRGALELVNLSINLAKGQKP